MSTTPKIHETPKRAGGEKRGNSYDRRRRKNALLVRHGDGMTCPCAYCDDEMLTFDTLEQDRIAEGGSYRMNNLIPAGRRCNLERSDMPFEQYVATKARNPERARQFAQIAQNAR